MDLRPRSPPHKIEFNTLQVDYFNYETGGFQVLR